MTVRLDMNRVETVDNLVRKVTNLHSVGDTGLAFQIQISAGEIRFSVENPFITYARFMTPAREFLASDASFAKNGVLSFSLSKADSVTQNALGSLELDGNFIIEVKRTMNRKQETQDFLVNIRR